MKRIVIFLLCAGLLIGTVAAFEYQTGGVQDAVAEVSLPVIMYHHISENPRMLGKYVISPQEFEQDLAWLHDNGWEPISVTDLLAWYDGSFTMPEKPCMITFDDGYESTLVYAEPLLKEYGYTAVVAVIGSICQLYSDQPDHNLAYSHMSWEAVSEMSQRGTFEIQYHTWDMHHLSPRKGCSMRSGESADNYRSMLENDLQLFLDGCTNNGIRLVPSVAYPYGAFNKETTDFFRGRGFRVAFTCQEQCNTLYGDPDELWCIGRFNRPHGTPISQLF